MTNNFAIYGTTSWQPRLWIGREDDWEDESGHGHTMFGPTFATELEAEDYLDTLHDYYYEEQPS